MEKKPIDLLFIICYLFFSVSATFFSVSATAQPSWTKKVTKSVFSLKTFDANGTPLGTATGFYVSTDGQAMSCFALFKGATRALIVDAAGKEHEVTLMLGANDTYDVARFQVDARKTEPLTIAPGMAATGTQLWFLPWREAKALPEGTVTKVETIQQEYGYYTVSSPAATVAGGFTAGTPLLDADGLVVGILQQPYAGDTVSYAVSARFADSLRIGGLSINDPALRSTHIKKALPDDMGQAQLTLYVAAGQMDSTAYAALLDDFIAKFPKSHEGYVSRAHLAANGNNYEQADRDMAEALRVTDKADDVHYSLSRLIYQKIVERPNPPYPAWTLDRALSETQAAYTVSPQPTYRHQEAMVLYEMKRYDDAYAIYDGLFQSQLRSPELFYEASRCKVMAGDTVAQLALLDSCLACFSKPYLKEASTYLFASAAARAEAGKHREAVTLYNEFEKLMAGQVNDQFYYFRFQSDVNGRLYQQAIDDINRAISIAPQNDLYYAEKCTLLVRLGLYDETEETANECIRIAPDHSDGYLFLGLAQCLKGQKDEGKKNLQKALDLGDPQAEDLINKYAN